MDSSTSQVNHNHVSYYNPSRAGIPSIIAPKGRAAWRAHYDNLLAKLMTLPRDNLLWKFWNGCWVTLSDGRSAMVYSFYAYEPPVDGNYRHRQILKRIGFFDPASGTVDSTKMAPILPPDDVATWPWA